MCRRVGSSVADAPPGNSPGGGAVNVRGSKPAFCKTANISGESGCCCAAAWGIDSSPATPCSPVSWFAAVGCVANCVAPGCIGCGIPEGALYAACWTPFANGWAAPGGMPATGAGVAGVAVAGFVGFRPGNMCFDCSATTAEPCVGKKRTIRLISVCSPPTSSHGSQTL